MTNVAPNRTAIAGPPLPPYHDASWSLISQGAEARLWKVPNYYSIATLAPTTGDGTAATTAAACKERFPKSYRHPTLDATITKSRTKGEARCLVRCRRGGVPCPAVLGVDAAKNNSWKASADAGADAGVDADAKPSPPPSSCIFLEWIDGCTVREYLEKRAHYPEDEHDFEMERDSDDEVVKVGDMAIGSNDGGGEPPAMKRAKLADGSGADKKQSYPAVKMTRVDDEALSVARGVGILVADMHNVNIVHGDLTTSNVMMRNPPPLDSDDGDDTSEAKASAVHGDRKGNTNAWKPSLVLIDFGLSGTAGSKGVSHEEKAVDLYVLERAFEATHPGSKELVSEIHRGYKGRCKTSDSVLQRLSQVRLRGRKRECFG